VLKATSRRTQLTGARELVVVALGGLGDQLLLTPFIRHFRLSGRYTRIVCACRPDAAQVFDRNPNLDGVIRCPGPELFFWALPRADRDVFLPFHTVRMRQEERGSLSVELGEGLNPGRGRGHVLKQIARHGKLALRDWHLDLFTARSDRVAAGQLVRLAGPAPLMLLALKSALVEKNLSAPLRRALRHRLREQGFSLAEVDGRRLRIGRKVIPLPGIRTMAEFAKRCSAIVAVDSFMGHLAACVGTPAVVLFGPADPSIYGHPGNINLRPSACPPCGGTARRKACKAPVCMEAFSVNEIADLVAEAVAR
jgi:hypothetical protein